MTNLKAYFDSRRRKKLATRRNTILSAIRWQRSTFETMVQRAQNVGDPPTDTLLTSVRGRLTEIEQGANQETNVDELDNLIGYAEQQGQLRAYICPRAEIRDEGTLAINLMEEWNVPKTVIDKLRSLLAQKLENAYADQEAARSALRAIFEEYDSWESYTGDYEETMQRFTVWLFVATIILPLLAVLAFHWPLTFLGGLFLAGASGSCVSVMSKMPVLEVSLSGELESYGRRISSRIGAGVVASLIGCALLGWGLISISIQGQTFASVLNDCSASPCSTCPPASCTGLKTLILLGVPMLFGFSERALTSIEQRVFGNSKGGAS